MVLLCIVLQPRPYLLTYQDAILRYRSIIETEKAPWEKVSQIVVSR